VKGDAGHSLLPFILFVCPRIPSLSGSTHKMNLSPDKSIIASNAGGAKMQQRTLFVHPCGDGYNSFRRFDDFGFDSFD
jgi:hypothetical protein